MIGILGVAQVKKLHEDAKLPSYANQFGDSGADVFAVESYEIKPGARMLIRTGIAVIPPDGYEIQVRSKSGLALKRGLMVLNSPGTVDNIYRGEVGVIIYNTSTEPQFIDKGDKVAQIVISPVQQALFQEVESFIGETARGENGFGSTGK